MCTTCGCDQDAKVTITIAGEGMFRALEPEPLISNHQHHSLHVELERDVLAKNNSAAEHNRLHFADQHVFAVNLVSAPGSGKTTLLERTLQDLKDEMNFFVIEGDQQTMNDANRIAATGVPAVQINTGKGCHLDADMIHRALHELNPTENSVLFIENVGNLVCPALFDLGENARVTVVSVTEGDDKPLKYPDMFASSDLCIINKSDLLPYVNFSVSRFKEYARTVNPHLKFLEVSATTGEGMFFWYRWLKAKASFCFSSSELEVVL
jgi:hydrogenase nickel incorporation protein HypB